MSIIRINRSKTSPLGRTWIIRPLSNGKFEIVGGPADNPHVESGYESWGAAKKRVDLLIYANI